jgi:hypothetical protein
MWGRLGEFGGTNPIAVEIAEGEFLVSVLDLVGGFPEDAGEFRLGEGIEGGVLEFGDTEIETGGFHGITSVGVGIGKPDAVDYAACPGGYQWNFG